MRRWGRVMTRAMDGSNAFYDDMFERLEQAADRSVLARWREACPKISDQDVESMWLYLVGQKGRAEARSTLDGYLDLHERSVALGLPGMFDASGNVLDDDGDA